MFAININIISSIAFALGIAACGKSEETANYRKAGISGLEAVAEASKVDLIFKLPHREVDPALASSMNGYYYRLQGEGAKCPEGQTYEEVGAYEDQKVIQFKVTSQCNYTVSLKLGSLQAPALRGDITYDEDIKSLIQDNCISCHDNLGDYQEVLSTKDDLLRAIEAGTMPPTAPLSDGDVAKFLAWGDGGYLEKNTAPPPTEKEQGLSQIYYRNNNNDLLMSYELSGRTLFELRRSLWLQADGEKLGLTVNELLSFDPTPRTTP